MRTLLTVLLCCATAAIAQSTSQIEAHVPAAKDFRSFLIRDVSDYLSRKESRPLCAECQLLRDVPTQSGVAYPKFYAWVRGLDENSNTIVEGVIRLAAIEKKRFEVTDFITRAEIVAEPSRVEGVFPRLLVPVIKERAGVR